MTQPDATANRMHDAEKAILGLLGDVAPGEALDILKRAAAQIIVDGYEPDYWPAVVSSVASGLPIDVGLNAGLRAAKSAHVMRFPGVGT